MGLFIFNKSLVSSRSAKDGSTDVDLFAVPIDSLANITSTSGIVSLYFKEGNSYTALTGGTTNIRGYEYAQVELTVDAGQEQSAVTELGRLLVQVDKGERSAIIVDIPNETIQILGVTGINTIKRFDDLTTIATDPSDGGASLPIGGVENQVLTKQSATDGDADWEYPHTLYVTVRNTSGGTLAKGTPVHATGVTGNVADVIAADASNASAMPCTYVLNEEIANNAQGIAILTGTIEGVDTSAFSAGDVIYVAVGGGFTNVKPTGTNLIQNLGVVTKSNASTGSGIVYGTGRSNDVPNLPTGKFFIGSATNTTESAYTLPTADGSANQVLTTDGAGAVTFQTPSGGNEYIQFNGSANNGNSGADRIIPLGGNSTDTSSFQIYSEALCPFAGVVESVTAYTANAAGSTTTKLWVNRTAVNNSVDSFSAATPITIAFGDSVTAGQRIAVSMNTTSAAGDTWVVVLIKKS